MIFKIFFNSIVGDNGVILVFFFGYDKVIRLDFGKYIWVCYER